jgi:glycerol kinase
MRRGVLALDQGTTSSRALVVDESGRIVASAQRELTQHYPQPGWVEHGAAEIWATQLATAREAMAQAAAAQVRVIALGLTNQRETVVLWDRASGEALAPAIVWQDRRTSEQCAQLRRRGLEQRVSELSGLRLDPYFSATKIAWLLDHLPGARARAQAGALACGTIDSWLVWKLTGGAAHLTDASNASRTALFDLHRGDWSDELCALFGVPRSLMPRVVDSSGALACCDSALFGMPLPITGIAGDQQAALFGQRCVQPGMAKNTYGTGCFLLLNTGAQPVASRHNLLSTVAWRMPADAAATPTTSYALEGSVFIGGAVVQWLRDALGIIRSSAEVEALAASVPDSGGVTFVPAFTGLGAPYWDADARGAILGLTRGSGAAHIARAALEAIAFQSADLLDAMQADAGLRLTELRVDGGAARNDALMQFQADLLGVPVLRPAQTECTALGAALLAGRGVGLWSGEDALDAQWQLERRFEPLMPRAQAEASLAHWRGAVERVRSAG